MNAPVRQVCGGCLRSVEVTPGPDGATSNTCPHCGGPIESQEASTVLTGRRSTETEDRLDATPDLSETPEWAETWSRGTLGSLGRFQLREHLGDGGFGQVFLAYDPRLDRDVALKVLKQPHPTERVMERFFREARAAARLDHPNIVSVHDAGFDDGRCWVAFHYVGGRPLGWYRDHHRMDPATAARILRELADAVDHAHHQGVVHRDLKPANVLIDDLGRPRLIDFGLSRRSDLDSSLTRDGAVVGTPAYMSPEQALGFSRQADERSDVFSLGVILFEILSGQRPLTERITSETHAGTSIATLPKSKVPSPSVRAINNKVPASLDRICRRAIAANPDERYPTARALADDLDRWLLRDRGQKGRLARLGRASLLGLAGIVLLVLSAGLAQGWWDRTRTQDPRHATTEPRAVLSLGSPKAGMLVGNLGKKRYHLPTCADLESMSESNRLEFQTPEEAVARGLKPCAHCKPPTSPTPPGTPDA